MIWNSPMIADDMLIKRNDSYEALFVAKLEKYTRDLKKQNVKVVIMALHRFLGFGDAIFCKPARTYYHTHTH
jgi:hypothetical protein